MESSSIYPQVLSKFIKNYGKTIIIHYVQAPIGIVVILLFAFLVDMLINLLPFTFPAQAICMIVLFFFMLFLHWVSPSFLFHYFHQFLHPAAEWLLASMGLFFTSSFILIPKKDVMPGKEIGLIAALFLPSFVVTWAVTVFLCKGVSHVWPHEAVDALEKDNNADVLDESERGSIRPKSSHHSANSAGSMPQAQIRNQAVTSHITCQGDEISINEQPIIMHEANPALELDLNATLTMNDPHYSPDVDDPEKILSKSEKGPRGFVIVNFAKFKKAVFFSPSEDPEPQSNVDVLSKRLEKWFDPGVYMLVFLIGLPLFYSPGGESRSLPLFTGVVSLAWLFSRRVVPIPWQKILHPILVTSLITVFTVWALGAIRGLSLAETLGHYSTGSTYLVLFRKSRGWNSTSPGAGDLMSSLLVGGIVVLAFPLFRYRHDLFHNFFRLLLIVTPNCVAALLLWPWLAHVMGLSGERAITFAGRFMSTPFGIQLLVATGGDDSLVVVLICITGILAVLVRDPLFKLCRTRISPGSDDYFTIGCTIGVIAGAIGTSSLMVSHSRAAATATVMFVLYGLILLAMVAVPTIADYVGQLAGL